MALRIRKQRASGEENAIQTEEVGGTAEENPIQGASIALTLSMQLAKTGDGTSAFLRAIFDIPKLVLQYILSFTTAKSAADKDSYLAC